MKWTKYETDLIHIVMTMAYEQGRERGKEEAKEVIRSLSDKVSKLYAKHEKEGAR